MENKKKKERLFTHEKQADNENTEVFDKDSDYTELVPQPNRPRVPVCKSYLWIQLENNRHKMAMRKAISQAKDKS